MRVKVRVRAREEVRARLGLGLGLGLEVVVLAAWVRLAAQVRVARPLAAHLRVGVQG